MAKLSKSWITKTENPFNSSMLKIGEMMECTDERLPGEILIGVFGGFISLTKHNNTWINSKPKDPYVGRKLLPGESVTLTQE